jgi:hypothetical protein
MARAADALARSAQNGPNDPGPDRDAVRGFRGVAAIVAQSRLSKGSPLAWAMLIDQLGQTLRAIGDAHVARGETETARLLTGDLSRELVRLHDRFERSTPQELAPDERITDDRTIPDWFKIPEHHVARHRVRASSHERGFGR